MTTRPISNEQWDLIIDQYGGLIWKIAHRISGDNATASLEDNYQDLCIAAMDAIRGFEKKVGKKFDEFFKQGKLGGLFNQYLKTCLWNHKNNKGARIVKRYNLTKYSVSLDPKMERNPKVSFRCRVPHGRQVEDSIFIGDMKELLGDEQSAILKAILDNPKCVKEGGTVNGAELCRVTGLSPYRVRRAVRDIEDIINRDVHGE